MGFQTWHLTRPSCHMKLLPADGPIPFGSDGLQGICLVLRRRYREISANQPTHYEDI